MYPAAWRQVEELRQSRERDGVPDWPEWCFLPMGGWYAIVSEGAPVCPPARIQDVARLAAIGTWRYTQSIYRLDPDLFGAIVDTVPSGALPCDVLYRLPEWCVYIETPGMDWYGDAMRGFWAHLESDANTGRAELRFVMDCEAALTPAILHMGPWTITEAVDRELVEADRQATLHKMKAYMLGMRDDTPDIMARAFYPVLSLLLYVCSNGVEYSGPGQPGNPTPKRTKKGWRLFPADKLRIWNLGEKTGDAIRSAREMVRQAGERKGPAPHVRRAHWHGYWTGPREGEREFVLKWLPPMVVAAPE
jgi:hypothetical protein